MGNVRLAFRSDVRLKLEDLDPAMVNILRAALSTAPSLYMDVVMIVRGNPTEDSGRPDTPQSFNVRFSGLPGGNMRWGTIQTGLGQRTTMARQWTADIADILGPGYTVRTLEESIFIQHTAGLPEETS